MLILVVSLKQLASASKFLQRSLATAESIFSVLIWKLSRMQEQLSSIAPEENFNLNMSAFTITQKNLLY